MMKTLLCYPLDRIMEVLVNGLNNLIFELFSISSDIFRPTHPSLAYSLLCDELQLKFKMSPWSKTIHLMATSYCFCVCVCVCVCVHTCELQVRKRGRSYCRFYGVLSIVLFLHLFISNQNKRVHTDFKHICQSESENHSVVSDS